MILEPRSDLGTLAGVSPAGLPPAQVGQIAAAVAAALDYLHGQGRVHGDVRPSNIVIGPQGQLMLSDGVAPLTRSTPLQNGFRVGQLTVGRISIRWRAPCFAC